jgi:pantetheine-phosphate adenylyltransferase
VTTALVPGSFDPPTNGHVDVIARCAAMFDRVVVGIVINPSKQPMFSPEERNAMLVEACPWENIEVAGFEGLLVDFARQVGGDVIVKGLRAQGDFDYELQLAQMNRHLSGIDTMFVPTRPDLGYLSSSLVKEVASFGGNVDELVPPVVAKALADRFPA